MLIAGEASGDLHASKLIKALREIDNRADFRFFGGDNMADAARRSPEVHYRLMNVMGFSEVIRHLPQLLRNLKKAKEIIKKYRPDVLILVDYPSFNLRLAKYAKSLGIRVDWYISPKVWAWKAWRVKKIKKYVSDLFCILPFEPEFYSERGYHKAKYVGNPSVAEIDDALHHLPPLKYFMQRQGLDEDGRPLIALLPGSRKSEIRNNLPLMIKAAKRFPEYQYVVAAAPSVAEKFYREVAQDPKLNMVFDSTVTLLKYSRAALVTSGTATLETALVGTPQVVCYRANGSKLSFNVMAKLLNVRYVSLPNLIAGNEIVPELLLHHCTVESIARELSPLLQNSPRREWELGGYRIMRRKLGTYVAAEYTAELIFDTLLNDKRQKRRESPRNRYRRNPNQNRYRRHINPDKRQAAENPLNNQKRDNNKPNAAKNAISSKKANNNTGNKQKGDNKNSNQQRRRRNNSQRNEDRNNQNK